MTRIHAFEGGAERANLDRNGDCRRQNLVTKATRDHERREARDHATIARGRISWRDRAAEDAYMALFY